MLWLLLGIATYVLFAITNVIDKHLMTHKIKHPYDPTIYFGLLDLLLCSAILVAIGFPYPGHTIVFSALVAGALLPLGIVLYLKALSLEEVSRIIPLRQLLPLFTLVLSTSLLNEQLSQQQYLAILLLIAGGVTISLRKKIRPSKAVFYILCMCAIVACSNVIVKALFNYMDNWAIYGWTGMGLFFGTAGLYASRAKKFNHVLAKMDKKTFTLLNTSCVFGLAGSILFITAVGLGPVSLVSSLSCVQALLVLLMSTVLTKLGIGGLGEEIRAKNLVQKTLGVIMISTGTLLLLLG